MASTVSRKTSRFAERSKDTEEFVQLLTAHQPRLYAYIRALVPVRSDAEEVLQQTSIALWQNFDQFERGTDFARWALKVAHFRVLEFRKQQQRDRLCFSNDFIEGFTPDSPECRHTDDRQRILAKCLSRLRQRDRELVQSRYRSGATLKSTSEEVGGGALMIRDTTSGFDSNELLSLLDSLCEGELSVAEAARIEELVRSNDAARALYLKYIELHAFLELEDAAGSPLNVVLDANALLGEPSPPAASLQQSTITQEEVHRTEVVEQEHQPGKLLKSLIPTADRLNQWLEVAPSAMMAVLLFACGVFVGVRMLNSDPSPAVLPSGGSAVSENTETPAKSAARNIASLTRTNGARWAESQPPEVGFRLEPGPLNLVEGTASIEFDSGVVVVLEGPAKFELETDGLGFLESGRLVANVPPQAVGFTIRTPTATVIDLGTEFGVQVDEELGTSEVHVFVGKVEVGAVGQDDDTTPPRRITAGQAVSVRAKTPVTELADAEPDRFVRSIEEETPEPQPTRVVTFQDGMPDPFTGELYTGTDDTTLKQWAPTHNFGKRGDLHAGGEVKPWIADGVAVSRALLRFDLSSLAGKFSKITSATLRLSVNTNVEFYPWDAPGELQLHRMSGRSGNWQEGNFLNGADAGNPGSGEVTWNQLAHGEKDWREVGAGRDFVPSPSARLPYEPRFSGTCELVLEGDLQFLEHWAKDPASNAGFLLRERSERKPNRVSFYSSEVSDVASRPQLVIEYVPLQQQVEDESLSVEEEAQNQQGKQQEESRDLEE
ncbi:unnamed protein product [Cladocopium goreaui]|uniref:RNA polymerase subunit sigma-70 n=1 Tax=Cladocopium goreaui TaxID=2562237 RepID=A0A9P1BEI4_9DINO|nr:unnamed protein product [Cladocopium goreaui]